MFERIDRVIVPVPDVRKASDWYTNEFEFRIARRGTKEIDLQVHNGETMVTLVESARTEAFQPLPHLHRDGHVPCFNFYTHWEDLHREWLQSRNVHTTGIMNVPWMNVCEMSDPDGNVLGMCHEKESSIYHTAYPGPLPPMFHRVLAVFIPVADVEASIRWYVDVLGFTLHHHWGDGADLKVGAGETIVTMIRMDAGVFEEAVREAGNRAYYSLQTQHIRDAYRSLAARGVTSDDCAEQDGVCRFHIRTPEGLTIRISEKERVRVG